MQKLVLIFLTMMASALFAPKILAQENAFKEDVRQMVGKSFIVFDYDDQVLWHGAGSIWKLVSSEGAPEDFAKHMDAFVWQGSRIIFGSEFCQENSHGLQNIVFAGHLDLSKDHGRPSNGSTIHRLILTTLGKGRGDEGCSQIRDLDYYRNTAPRFLLKGSRLWLEFYGRDGNRFNLVYQMDYQAQRLLQSQWKLMSDNLPAAEKCGPFTIRPHGFGSEPFIEGTQFYTAGAGWWPENPDSPLLVWGCSDKKDRAENVIKNRLKNGFKIDRNDRLIVDPNSKDPLIFEPAGILSDIAGKYKLTGLARKTYNPLFPAAPTERAISDRRALKKLGVKLEVKDTRITLTSKCATLIGDVFRRKADVIQIENFSIDHTKNCPLGDNPLHGISRYMGTILGENTVIKITNDKSTQQLTLTHSSVRRTESINWIFEP